MQVDCFWTTELEQLFHARHDGIQVGGDAFDDDLAGFYT